MKLADILLERKWSGDVITKTSPPEGLFASGTAKKIAAWAIQSHKDAKGAMGSVSFYINRAGKNLDAKRKSELETAKNLIRRHFES